MNEGGWICWKFSVIVADVVVILVVADFNPLFDGLCSKTEKKSLGNVHVKVFEQLRLQ